MNNPEIQRYDLNQQEYNEKKVMINKPFLNETNDRNLEWISEVLKVTNKNLFIYSFPMVTKWNEKIIDRYKETDLV